ncbi:MAG: class I SAM-dependent methyltransferase [Nitrospiraceae bacterium]|nr:MAG: class I SAM-dependent methyltransferase [Nitrospiraceae bacterium]
MRDSSNKRKWYAAGLLLLVVLSSSCNHQQAGHSGHSAPTAQHRFDDIDHWVKMFEDPARDEWQKPDEVVRAMNLRPGDVIADIGAGTGYFTRRFAAAVGPDGKALGLDIEPSMVMYMYQDAEKLGFRNYEPRVVRTDDAELSPRSVDVVFLCNTYHHLENRISYFSKVAGALKPGGRVIVVDFFKDTDFGPPREHKLGKEVVLEEMAQAGYRLMRDHDMLTEQYFLEFGK